MFRNYFLGYFLLVSSVSSALAHNYFQVLPDWVAEPVLDSSMEPCIKRNELGRLYSSLAHGSWAPLNRQVTLPEQELSALRLEELSKLSYIETGGQIVNVNGEVIEFIHWRGISISRILEVQEDAMALTSDDIKQLEARGVRLDDKTHWSYRPWKSWRHAFGKFEPHQLGGRILSFEMSRYYPLDCPPLGSSDREGCYAVSRGEGLLSYSHGTEATTTKVYQDCAGD